MPAVVRLEDLVDAFEGQSETVSSYLDRETGETVAVSEEAFDLVEEGIAELSNLPEWQRRG